MIALQHGNVATPTHTITVLHPRRQRPGVPFLARTYDPISSWVSGLSEAGGDVGQMRIGEERSHQRRH
ncbi:hypothetical protein, partial [Nonomuraea sp. NPDC049709]|uniref:hypothetical protein n=1 Tax=Nonomuraea sp. NPDC049709 TaxID=3154736 RepID=UPI003444C976